MTNDNKALMKLMMKLEAHTPVLQRFWNNTRVNSTGRLVKRFSAAFRPHFNAHQEDAL